MMVILGVVLVTALAFGGYAYSGGSMEVMMHALPYELTMVAGMSVLAFIISNSMSVVKRSGGAIGRAVKGPKWKEGDYRDLLVLMNGLAQEYRRAGINGLEPHIEKPDGSTLFQKFPRISDDHEARELIVDTFRLVMMQMDDPMEAEDIINRKIDAHHEHVHAPANALNAMADALPAIGIVAAVLGVIKTMASVDKPPEILGGMIGGALVGTFLGVYLAYCVVQPVAMRIIQIEDSDAAFSSVIRDVILSIMKGHPPPVCIEIGRGSIPPEFRPSFDAVEDSLRAPAMAA